MSDRRPWIFALGTLAVAAMVATGLAAAPGYPVRQDGEFSVIDTPHYHIRTDMGADVAQLVAAHQEALYAALFQRMSSFKPATIPRLDIVVVKTKEKFEQIVGKDAKGAQGLYQPGSLRIGVWGSPDDLDSLLQTLRHEGTHQFIGIYLGAKCPVWLNEGLAVFFEHGQFRDGQLVTGQVPILPLMSLKKALAEDKFIPIADVINMTSLEWTDAVKAKGSGAATQYNEAWATVHCLEAADNGKYRAPFVNYMGMVAHGIAAPQAWNRSFGSPPASLDKRLRDYILDLKPTNGMECRWNLKIIGFMMINAPAGRMAEIKDMADLRAAALGGRLGSWTITVGDYLKLESTDTEVLKSVFRCPEDTSKGDAPSYELVPDKDGGLPIVRCRHHPGFVLETTYTKDDKGVVTPGVVSRPASTVPPATTATTGTAAKTATAAKKPAPTFTGASNP